MKVRTTLAIACVGAVLFLTTPVSAHHSMTVQFAVEQPITLRGIVTTLIWTNPHSWIYVDVKGADGRVENWRVETGGLARMVKRGLKKTDLRPGTEVILGAYSARDGQLKAAGTIVIFPDREAAGREASFTLGR